MSSGTVQYGIDGARRTFGPSDVETKFPSIPRTAGEEVQMVIPLVYNDLNGASASDALDAIDRRIPANSILTRCVVKVPTVAFAGGTSYDVGTYLASDGTTAVNADAILAAVTTAVVNAGKAFYPGTTLGGDALGLTVGTADVVVVVAATGTFTAGATEIVLFYVKP